MVESRYPRRFVSYDDAVALNLTLLMIALSYARNVGMNYLPGRGEEPYSK